MADIILHHYPTSPFSEKVRAILGYKRLSWRSVHVPTIMPKPDLLALTGGYRRAPVLQIGADVYCDTKLMARVLERQYAEPALVPAGMEATCAMVEQWSEQLLFFLVIPVVLQKEGMAHFFAKAPPQAVEAFRRDRDELFAGGRGRRASLGATQAELPALLATLETQLTGLPYLLGATPTLADFCVFHPLWFIFSNPGVASYLDRYPQLQAWTRRLAAYGHGFSEKLDSGDALAIAREATPSPNFGTEWPDPSGARIGDPVEVSATDYGTEPSAGELVWSTQEHVSIRRVDERAGTVVVHFPRAGFRVERGG